MTEQTAAATETVTLSRGTVNLATTALRQLRVEVARMRPEDRRYLCELADIDRAIEEIGGTPADRHSDDHRRLFEALRNDGHRVAEWEDDPYALRSYADAIGYRVDPLP
jgi:hypothetical protein